MLMELGRLVRRALDGSLWTYASYILSVSFQSIPFFWTYYGNLATELVLDLSRLDRIGAVLADDLEQVWRRSDC